MKQHHDDGADSFRSVIFSPPLGGLFFWNLMVQLASSL
jgi:hypothetical protein